MNNNICKSIRSLIGDFLDGNLPEKRRSKIGAHLAKCTGCRKAFDRLSELPSIHKYVVRPPLAAHIDEWVSTHLEARLDEIDAKRAQEGVLERILRDSSIQMRRFFEIYRLQPIPVAVVATMVLLIGLTGINISDRMQLPVVASIKGAAMMIDSRGDVKEMPEIGQRIARNSFIKTAPFSEIDLELPGKSQIRLKGQSSIYIAYSYIPLPHRTQTIHVKEGTLLCNVEPSAKRGFEVLFPSGSAVVKGTQFGVMNVSNVFAEVWVKDGRVLVHAKSIPEPVMITGGQKATIGKGASTIDETALSAKEKIYLDQIDAVGKVHGKEGIVPQASVTPLIDISFALTANEQRTLWYIKESRLLGESMRSAGKGSSARLNGFIEETKGHAKSAPAGMLAEWLIALAYLQEAAGKHIEAIATLESIEVKLDDPFFSSFALMAAGLIAEESLDDGRLAEKYYQAVILKYPESLEASGARTKLKRLIK
ncbi:MAG: FecR domain-containing protein [Candidatus Omnitrophica bacterium]|nr:FecR domain-containing protein [Candidatus Omnitrophota bacterium]